MNCKKIQWMIIVMMFFSMTAMVHSENKKEQATEQAVKVPEGDQKKNRTTGKQNKVNRPAEFIPSEKIHSDTSVSFPVDI